MDGSGQCKRGGGSGGGEGRETLVRGKKTKGVASRPPQHPFYPFLLTKGIPKSAQT